MNLVEIPWAAWYGDGQHRLTFPESWTVSSHEMHGGPAVHRDEIDAVLSLALDWTALAQKANGIRKVAIAVDDLTRPTPAWRLLPPLLSRLQQAGIDQDRVQILMALGNHRVMVLGDLVKKLGQQVASNLDVRNHSPFSNLADLGRSSYGLPIEVNRTFAEADLKIGIGCILPHGHTGFSGGAKFLLPGLSAIDMVQQFHQMRPLCSDGQTVDRQKIRDEMLEIADKVGLDLLVNVIVNAKREIVDLCAGDIVKVYQKGVEAARRVYATNLPDREVDVVVLNAYPKDTECYQVLNAVQILQSTGRMLVHEEGTIVLTTAASEGMGFHYLFGPEGLVPHVFDPAKALGGRRLFIYSPSVPESEVRPVFPTGMEFFRNWDDLLGRLRDLYGQSCRVAVLPCASMQTEWVAEESGS